MGSSPAQAQDWGEYVSAKDLFTVSFPGEPVVRESLYESEYEIVLPAREYAIDGASGTYALTAVDWRGAERIHEARFALCRESGSSGCANSWRDEIRGSVAHAAGRFLARGGQVTYFGHHRTSGVEGLRIELLDADGWHASAVIHWHESRLYVVEARSANGGASPRVFFGSLGFLDSEGKRIQYRDAPYSPLSPAPPRAR
jgi:hypothetical protein